MKERIKAICLEKPNNVVVKEVPYPEKSDNDVLIQVESMGICGSDIGAYRGN